MADRKTTALALVATFIVLAAHRAVVKGAAPGTKQVVGFAVVFLFLGFLVEIPSAARTAKYFALLFFLGVLTKKGPDLFRAANTRIRTPVKAPVRVTSRAVNVPPK